MILYDQYSMILSSLLAAILKIIIHGNLFCCDNNQCFCSISVCALESGSVHKLTIIFNFVDTSHHLHHLDNERYLPSLHP